MPLMEVTLTQSFVNQVMVNRWNYVAGGTPAAVSFSFALTSALGAVYDAVHVPPEYPETGMMNLLASIQSTGVTFQGIEVRNVYSNTDFYATPFVPTLNGKAAATPLSPAMAIGFHSNRVRLDIRRATKRIGGVASTFSENGGNIPAAIYNDFVLPVAAKMSEVLEYDDEGNTITFTPCVVAKQKYAVPDSNPVRYAYRYIPEEDGGEAAQLAQTAVGVIWSPYIQLRTQTSRQYGRGV